MSNQSYNGWTNKQTWNINLMYGEMFATMAEEQKYDGPDQMADSFEQIVNDLEFEGLRSCSLAHQAVSEYLDRVDWQELAEHFYVEEAPGEDDEVFRGLRELLAEAN